MLNHEILFHAKRKDNGAWVEGNYLHLHHEPLQHDEDMHIIVDSHGVYHLVDPDTVSQYTGIDDICGKKIFLGDVLRFDTFDSDTAYKVEFINAYFTYGVRIRNGETILSFNKRKANELSAIVIGNIFDDPELLEEGAGTKND